VGFFEKDTMLELLRPAAVIATIFLIEKAPAEHSTKIVIGVVAIFLLALLDFLLRKGARFHRVRHYWHPISEFEGIWLQRVDNVRPYSIACIDYDGDGRWKYYGVGYDPDFKPAAKWTTSSMPHKTAGTSWFFAGDAETLEFNPRLQNYKGSGRGYVVPIINLPAEKLWDRTDQLDGQVVDLRIDQKDEVYGISLYRAKKPPSNDRLPLLEEIMKMSSDKVRQMFIELKIPLLSETPAAPPHPISGT
jgi:hypothetical protein